MSPMLPQFRAEMHVTCVKTYDTIGPVIVNHWACHQDRWSHIAVASHRIVLHDGRGFQSVGTFVMSGEIPTYY